MSYGECELDRGEALLGQLPVFLNGRRASQLTPEAIAEIPPDAQGACLLFHRGKLVYGGKSGVEAGIRRRLERHHMRVHVRENISPAESSFKACRIYTFPVIDVEMLLIRFFLVERLTLEQVGLRVEHPVPQARYPGTVEVRQAASTRRAAAR